MSNTFDDREKSFEAKFKQDQEFEFKVAARRNKLLGKWLAGEFNLSGAAADDYATEIVIADFEEPGDEDVIRKVMADIADKGLDISEETVRHKLTALEGKAREELQGVDHEGVTR